MSELLVTKRNGDVEPLDLEKFHRVCIWATEDITGVSASEIELKSHIQFYNKIKTTDIQETLIKSAADLISEDTPNYQYVAGRLISYHLRKQVYGSFAPCYVKDLVIKNIDRGFYDPELLEKYNDKEWDIIEKFIKHERDDSLTYVAMEQMRSKYLVQNRVNGEIYETPQITYALIAVTLFGDYPKDTRLHWAKEYYNTISLHEISLPTPVMAGVRTKQRQFSSCVLIDAGDSLDSINATASSIVKYVSQRAGIGINAGRIRSQGSPIREGDVSHTGMIPFLKYFNSAVSSCNQGGIRRGCVQKDSYVERINGIVYNDIKYFRGQIIIKNNKVETINNIIETIAYMKTEEEKNAYLQNMFEGVFTVKNSSNNNS